MKRRLIKEIQCAKCPWKVSTDPNTISGGYSIKRHRNLKRTIARPGELRLRESLRSMACHESPKGKEFPCVGWLMNQLGPGNNIALRLQMLDYDLSRVRTVGPQHERFEDTVPTK